MSNVTSNYNENTTESFDWYAWWFEDEGNSS